MAIDTVGYANGDTASYVNGDTAEYVGYTLRSVGTLVYADRNNEGQYLRHVGLSVIADAQAAAAAAPNDLTGTASLSFGSAAVVNAVGALVGAAALTFGGTSGTLTAAAANDLDGAASLSFTGSATANATGTLTGAGALAFAGSGTANATGSLAGTGALSFSPSGTLTFSAANALVGTASLTFGSAADLSALGTLTGAAGLVFGEDATLNATGTLAGAGALSFTGSGTLEAIFNNTLQGSASVSFTGSGGLNATGTLTGTSDLSLTGSGTLSGFYDIAGTAAMSFTATGLLAAEEVDTSLALNIGRGDLVFYDSGWDKRGVQNVDFYFEVSDGGVGRHWHEILDTTVSITTGNDITLWPLAAGGTPQDYAFASSAQPLALVSSSSSDSLVGTGAKVVKILGLDSNWDPIEESVEMNGTSVVNTTKSFLRVNNVLVTLAGGNNVAVGNIRVLTTTETVDFEVGYIPAGYAISLTSVFSIPRGHRYHIKEQYYGYHSTNVGQAEFWYEYTHSTAKITQVGRRHYVTNDRPVYESTKNLSTQLAGPADLVMKVNVSAATAIPVNASVDGVLVGHFDDALADNG